MPYVPRHERIGADSQITLKIATLGYIEMPETSRVVVTQLAAVLQSDAHVEVLRVERFVTRAGPPRDEPTGHPQVDQHDATGAETDDNVLAYTLDPVNDATDEAGQTETAAPVQRLVLQARAHDTPPRQLALQATGKSLDFRQFGHLSPFPGRRTICMDPK
jgi:hypothetical protein